MRKSPFGKNSLKLKILSKPKGQNLGMDLTKQFRQLGLFYT